MWLLLNVLILKCQAPKREKGENEGERNRLCFFKSIGRHCCHWMCLATMVAHFWVCNFMIRNSNQRSEHRPPITEGQGPSWLLWFPGATSGMLALLPAMGLGAGTLVAITLLRADID